MASRAPLSGLPLPCTSVVIMLLLKAWHELASYRNAQCPLEKHFVFITINL